MQISKTFGPVQFIGTTAAVEILIGGNVWWYANHGTTAEGIQFLIQEANQPPAPMERKHHWATVADDETDGYSRLYTQWDCMTDELFAAVLGQVFAITEWAVQMGLATDADGVLADCHL